MRAARVDQGSQALVAYARSLGLGVHVVNGTIDAVVWLGDIVEIVDWKAPGGELTAAQRKLVAQGCPIRFLSTPQAVDFLFASMRRRALR